MRITLADVLTITTLAGIAVYVVGLVGLAMAIRLRFTDDLSEAWYVVSLLPRTIVGGQGMRIWLEWPIPFAVLVILVTACVVVTGAETAHTPHVLENLLHVLDPHWQGGGKDAPDSLLRLLVSSLAMASLAVYLALVLRAIVKAKEWGKKMRQREPDIGHVISATLMATFGGLVMAEGAYLTAHLITHNDGVHQLLLGPILFIVAGFLVGVPAAAIVEHPLPSVKVTRIRKNEQATASSSYETYLREAYLVDHTDGFWYFFDERNELLAIPDNQIISVRTLMKPEKSKKQR